MVKGDLSKEEMLAELVNLLVQGELGDGVEYKLAQVRAARSVTDATQYELQKVRILTNVISDAAAILMKIKLVQDVDPLLATSSELRQKSMLMMRAVQMVEQAWIAGPESIAKKFSKSENGEQAVQFTSEIVKQLKAREKAK